MATLTFRVQPSEPKAALKKFGRSFKEEIGPSDKIQWAWIMEWQLRGVVHFHLFFEKDLLDSLGFLSDTEVVMRRGVETTLIRGPFDEWLQQTWTKAVGDRDSAFRSFQAGGIIELLRTPDAAGRYVAKEAGKRQQKKLPDGVACAGRWWWISPAGRPKPIGVVMLEKWPYPKAYKHVFDVADLQTRRFREVPLTLTRADRT